jgi:hypothetical protein
MAVLATIILRDHGPAAEKYEPVVAAKYAKATYRPCRRYRDALVSTGKLKLNGISSGPALDHSRSLLRGS